MLLAGGLAILTALQIFLIIGGVTKFLPLTGITLPLISYGGSSMVSSFILLGMLFAISEATVPNEQ
jgi:peptidoglycan glycosyltransferase